MTAARRLGLAILVACASTARAKEADTCATADAE